MSEANFWKQLRQNLPKGCMATRIENVHGGGIPDVHMLWGGLPFWCELKVTKGNTVKVSPNQVAWNTSYHARGGLNFYLVKREKEGDILLFEGNQGSSLVDGGISATPFARFPNPASLFKSLRPRIFAHYSASLRPSIIFVEEPLPCESFH